MAIKKVSADTKVSSIKVSRGVTTAATPTEPVVGTVLNSADVAVVPFTPSPLGQTATSWVATSSPGGLTATNTTSPVVYSAGILSTSTTYTFSVSGVSSQGTGKNSSASNSVVTTPTTYTLNQTFNSSGTYTVPAGALLMTVIGVSAGSAGASGSDGFSGTSFTPQPVRGYGGAGGSGGAAFGFKDYFVTPGQTFSVTVGSTTQFGNLGTAVAAGTANSNASGAILKNASAGGGEAIAGTNQTAIDVSSSGVSSLAIGGGGGGGGTGRIGAGGPVAGGAAGNGAGAGGASSYTYSTYSQKYQAQFWYMTPGYGGGSANALGGGGGGGGGGAAANYGGGGAGGSGNGGNGGAGQLVVYVK